MAIFFFNLNRGGGGGSGGIMTLDNGLNVNVPGNGQLGGNLLHTTIIGLNGEILEINGGTTAVTFSPTDTTLNQQDGTDQSFLQIVPTAATLKSLVSATGVNGEVLVTPGQVQISGHDTTGTIFSQVQTNQVETDITASDPGTGRGEVLVTAGDVHIDVQDIPGIQNSFVDIQQAAVRINSSDIGVGTSVTFFHPDEINLTVTDIAGGSSAIDLFSSQLTAIVQDAAGNRGDIQLDQGDFIFTAIRGSDNLNKSIGASFNDGNGIEVVDAIDDIGLQGDVLFPLNGNPNQYVQAGNVSVINSSADSANLVASAPALTSFVVPGGNGMFLINAYTFWRSGLGSVAVTVTYTDVLGNAITATLSVVACSTTNRNTSYSPIFIKALAGTTISVNWVLTGAMTYDAGGAIQLIGS